MNAVARSLRLACALTTLIGAAAHAEHVSLWGGGGVGTVLTGEDSPYVNGHKMFTLSAALPGDKVRLRLLIGSLERTQGIETGTGDNDLDYRGVDAVLTRSAFDLPFAVAIGAARYE